MSTLVVFGLLLAAALLETGADAVIRLALHTPAPAGGRMLLFVAGAATLFGYGYLVNTVPWDFGRLLGLYIVLFFIVAQMMGWIVFGQAPPTGIYVGGAFILIGGAIISVGH